MRKHNRTLTSVITLALTLVACEPGTLVRPSTDFLDASLSDAGRSADSGGQVEDLDAGLPLVDCVDLQGANGDGEHHAGDNCLDCHQGGGEAPRFTVGGTLYDAPSGGSQLAGATIRITDATGKTINLVTAKNGNFYTSSNLEFPLTVDGSACPTTLKMVTPVPANGGGCNTSGCHDNDFRIYLP